MKKRKIGILNKKGRISPKAGKAILFVYVSNVSFH
jgi:hypothetical protein